ncbi:MAG: sigma-70 family RNA polymerase sigma factor [Defluviitaleaceae bacterium]|nr:sigma-70 family RNA polymerase sigma factor [Defluviitaleaceae bacterium]
MAQIFEMHYGLMIHRAKLILKDKALAEDAASESLEKLMKIVGKIGDVSCNKTKALIVIIVDRTALNILKKLNRIDFNAEDELDNLVSSSPDIPDEIISVDGYRDILSVINQLTPALKNVAVLSLVYGLQSKEIAEILKINDGTVRTRLSRAREELKSKLERGDKYAK